MEGIKITLDKERTIQFDYNALIAVEKETGINVLQGEMLKRMRATDLRALLWAGLLMEDPSLSIEEVGRMITRKKTPVILDAIVKGLKDFFGE